VIDVRDTVFDRVRHPLTEPGIVAVSIAPARGDTNRYE